MTSRAYTTSKDSPPLEPILSDWIQQLLGQPERIREQLAAYGSPLNIHCLQPFRENLEEFAQIFKDHGLRHQIFFARKANKCQTFVQAANQGGFGVDTASFRELQQCLALDCDPQQLVFTAAVKDRRSVYLAVQNRVLIILDNRDEWELVREVANELGVAAKVGIRLSGFQFEGKRLYSRFGIDIDQALGAIKAMCCGPASSGRMEFHGLHFHLNGYSRRQRAAALHQSMDLSERLATIGLRVEFIDMGGGFLVNYLKEEEQFRAFKQALKMAVCGLRAPITFNNDGLGFQVIDGELSGSLKTYPYFNHHAKGRFLQEVLTEPNKAGHTVAGRARQLDIELRIEPGRSLLDQAGVTTARVAHRKRDSRGDLLVGLEMNMTQLYSSSADFLLDPTVIYREPTPEMDPVGVYFTGAYCLERDVLLKRKIMLAQEPAVGDLVVFPNTAGYMMHFFESEAHLFELATNLFYDPEKQQFRPDGA